MEEEILHHVGVAQCCSALNDIKKHKILSFEEGIGLNGAAWEWIQNLDFGGIGYILAGLFVLSWGFSYLLWKVLRLENA